MKFIHTADLHIGKIVCEHSMLGEQRYILARILEAVEREKPDAVLIAGDVYDKPVPSAEAVAVLDDFLVELAARKVRTFVLSGNHDSYTCLRFTTGNLCRSRSATVKARWTFGCCRSCGL